MSTNHKIALFADIHSNLEAFEACIDHAKESGADEFIFLGDLVGYNADPVAVIEKIAELIDQGKAKAVLGNHDQAVFMDHSKFMNADAWSAIEWTREQLKEDHVNFLKNLPLMHQIEDISYVHATAANPQGWGYIQDSLGAWRCSEASNTTYTFVGHVHEPTIYYESSAGKLLRFHPTPGETIPLARHRKWVTIIGSLGQPRDGNPATNYALFEPDQEQITFYRIDYDHHKTAHKVEKAGLPISLALRLLHAK